jgi:hypothetical protein
MNSASASPATPRHAVWTVASLWVGLLGLNLFSAEDVKTAAAPRQKHLFRGQVVLVADALKRAGIKAYSEELKDQVGLETADGELLPILPDWRGRAFFQDERLRNRKVELVGYRRQGLPYLQVLQVFTFDEEGKRQYTDYWCDICSIPMYEIKPCDCCQQDVRLRFQPQELPADLVEHPTKSGK